MQKYISNNDFSFLTIIKLLFVLFGIILSLRISDFSIFLLGAVIVFAVFQKKVEYIFVAFVCLLSLSIMNEVFFKKGFYFYLITRGSLLAMAVVLGIKGGSSKTAWFLSPFYWLFFYVVYMMVVSLVGWSPIISELKALLFLVVVFAIVSLISTVLHSKADISVIRSALLMIACFYILGSMATIPFPSIGKSMLQLKMERWGNYDTEHIAGLFNGVTWHSQALGPVVAMLNAFLLTDYICNIRRRSFLYWVLFACSPILIYLTSSRTALFAYIISILASVFFILKERKVSTIKKNQIVMNLIGGTLLVIAIVLLRPGGLTKAERFLRKAGDDDSIDRSVTIGDQLMESRMGLAEEGFANFKDSPLIGNGFQVSKEMQYTASEDKSLLSAPIEKGVLPVMILEEGGVFGGMIFLIFISSVYFKYSKLQFTCFLSTFTVFIALNSGEAVFFSTSGGGGLLWMICFSALLLDITRHRRMLVERAQGLANSQVVIW